MRDLSLALAVRTFSIVPWSVKERALARVAFGGEGVDNFGVSSVPKKVEKDNFCAPNLTASFVLTIFQIYS